MLSLTRITQIKAFFLVLFSLVLVRLFYWQVIQASKLVSSASKQRQSNQKIIARRGQISSSDGFPFVLNQELFTLYQNQADKSISLKDDDLNELVKIITKDQLNEASSEAEKKELIAKKEDSLRALLEQKGPYTILAKRLNKDQKLKIENLLYHNFAFTTELGRFYPEASMSAHLFGFLGKNEQGDDIGYFGLEGYYDSELRGKEGFIFREKDALLKPIFSGINVSGQKKDGRSLVLYTDRTIQYIVEDELSQALKRYGANAGTVIVSNPQTGGIVAMASLPAYDQREYWLYQDQDYKNPAIADTYEPGSTFKTVVMAIAIDTKAVDLETKCDICHGPYKLDKYTINTWNNKYYPDSNIADIIIHSDNVGMVYVSLQIKDSDFISYLKKFSFGSKTGIDLQEEVNAPLRKKWSYVDQATAAFGQGIAVTPIQMVKAVGVIANEGQSVNPRVVQAFIENEEKYNTPATRSVPVIKKETANMITDMMVAAVEEGESKWIKPPGVKVAGKTGTAQIPIAGHYDEEKTITSFIGFAPAYDPKYLILTILREPSSSQWGSETAAPLFFDILKRIILYSGL